MQECAGVLKMHLRYGYFTGKMALVTTSHVALPEKAYIELQNANANIDLVSTQSRSINDSASQFSTICDIECAYSPKILISLMC